MKENSNTLANVEDKITKHSHNEGEIVLYQQDEIHKFDVLLKNETIWLTQLQIAQLFGTQRQAITKHLKNIFETSELNKESVCSILELTAADGKRYKTNIYNLDAIIAVGYRINSLSATRFRQWATTVLHDHLLKGYSVNYHLVALQQQVDQRFVSLESRVDEQEQQVAFLVNMHQQPSEQIFASGCTWDAWAFVSALVREASQRVILIDNYVDDRTLLMLDKRQEEVSCTVYTRTNKQVEIDMTKHNEQNRPITLVAVKRKVHDRYLIIDQKVWLLGASVKDMGKGLCTVIELGFTAEEVLKKSGGGRATRNLKSNKEVPGRH